jgi:hypothetical protein
MNLTKSQLDQTLLAANYGQLGESEKGEKTIDLILEIHPKFANDPGVPLSRKLRLHVRLPDSGRNLVSVVELWPCIPLHQRFR